MLKSFVLMTAMPPTLGHLDLIKFAHALTGDVAVILCTQPDEPYTNERFDALVGAVQNAKLRNVLVNHIHQVLPQEPEGNEGFWDMWAGFLTRYGFRKGDYIVASEPYGKTLAEHVGGVFMPYDLDRSVRYTKATLVRDDPHHYFQDILPEFRRYLKKTVTLFGAESVGKTTLSRHLATAWNGLFLFEWARPYLESVGPEVTTERMYAIAEGQRALQKIGQMDTEHEFVFQDTDLFSTVGYWEMWDKASMPSSLPVIAQAMKSDLYIVLDSNIPFAPDPLRYGGDKRETTDQYWIDLCERENLNYIYLETGWSPRSLLVDEIIETYYPNDYLRYQRIGREYEKDV